MSGLFFEANRLGQSQVPTITVQLLRRVEPMLAEHTVKTNGYEFSVFSTCDPISNGTWVWTDNYPQKQLVHDIYSTSSTPAHRFLGLIRDVFLPAEIAARDRASRSGQWASEVHQALLTMIDDGEQGSQLSIHVDGTEREASFGVCGPLEEVMRAIKEAAKLCN